MWEKYQKRLVILQLVKKTKADGTVQNCTNSKPD